MNQGKKTRWTCKAFCINNVYRKFNLFMHSRLKPTSRKISIFKKLTSAYFSMYGIIYNALKHYFLVKHVVHIFECDL